MSDTPCTNIEGARVHTPYALGGPEVSFLLQYEHFWHTWGNTTLVFSNLRASFADSMKPIFSNNHKWAGLFHSLGLQNSPGTCLSGPTFLILTCCSSHHSLTTATTPMLFWGPLVLLLHHLPIPH